VSSGHNFSTNGAFFHRSAAISGSVWLGLVVVLSLAGTLPCYASPTMGDARQVSIGKSRTTGADEPPSGMASQEAGSEDPAISPDGNVLVFSSSAVNLVSTPEFASTSSETPNIFLKSLNPSSSAIELISVNRDGGYPKKAGSSNLHFGSINPSISRIVYTSAGAIDSYAVAFTSDAEDLVPHYEKPNVSQPNPTQVYLRLPKQGQTVLVSGAWDPFNLEPRQWQGADKASLQPAVALLTGGPGLHTIYRVVFRSSATNLSGNISGNYNNVVYWRDVSRTTLGQITVGPVNRVPVSAMIIINDFSVSHNGSKLAFAASGQIISGKNSEREQVYVFDFNRGDFRLISRTVPTNNTQPDSYNPASEESRHPSLSLTGNEIGFLHNANGGTNLASVSGSRPMMVTCNVPTEVHDSVFCTQVNTNKKGVPSSGEAKAGRIDASGRYVAFADTGKNLRESGQSDGEKAQVYLKYLGPGDSEDEKSVYLASQRGGVRGGPLASGQERTPSVLSSRPPVAIGASSGQVRVAFSSWAANLGEVGEPSDTNPYLFAAELGGQGDDTPTPTSTPTPTPTSTSAGPADDDDPGRDKNEDGGDDTDPEPEEGSLPAVDLREGAPIDVPARVEVVRAPGEKTAVIVITLPEVRIDPKLFEKLNRKDIASMAASGARIKYEVEIRKAGSKTRITRTSSRNVVTVRKLEPGRYTVRYRISASKGKRTIRSRQSVPTTITIT